MTLFRLKKIICISLSCILLLGAASCGKSDNYAGDSASQQQGDSKADTKTDTSGRLTEMVNDADQASEMAQTQGTEVVRTGLENLITDYDVSDATDDNYRNFYEIFPGYFYDSDDNGSGDLNGIAMKLDYISDLGCNGIWLTPIMKAPSYHKYDTSDYYMVDPALGTNEDFAALTEACHERGIKIIIDLVVNHSSSQHPWFLEACEYLRGLGEGEEPDYAECPYAGYYNFSREQKNATYREVSGSDWYYEAVFDYSQPDLNLYNEEVRSEIMKIADFWMGLGVDGFRMDAAMHYDDSDEAFNISFLNDLYTHCLEINPEFYMVSEVWASQSTIASYYASETPSFFNFDVADAEGKLIKAGRGTLSAEKFVNACVGYEENYGTAYENYIDAPFITNHDMGRVANALMCDPVSMKMTAGFLLTMSGSPFIYYGEEIGMKSKGKLDENKRLHMNWSATDMEGICGDPENADKDIVQDLPAADEQEADPDSLLSYYKEALAIRNAIPSIARGKKEIIDELTYASVAVVKKEWNGDTVYIAYNNGDESAKIPVSSYIEGDVSVVGLLEAGTHNSSYADGILELDGKSIAFLK